METGYNFTELEKRTNKYFFDNNCLKFGEYKLKTENKSFLY